MAKDIEHEEALRQGAHDTSLAIDLPGLEADRVVQASDEDIDALAELPQEDDVGDIGAEGERPSELREENIGLGHIAGIDDAEVGRELNVSGDEDDDEDDDGNPTGATQLGSP